MVHSTNVKCQGKTLSTCKLCKCPSRGSPHDPYFLHINHENSRIGRSYSLDTRCLPDSTWPCTRQLLASFGAQMLDLLIVDRLWDTHLLQSLGAMYHLLLLAHITLILDLQFDLVGGLFRQRREGIYSSINFQGTRYGVPLLLYAPGQLHNLRVTYFWSTQQFARRHQLAQRRDPGLLRTRFYQA